MPTAAERTGDFSGITDPSTGQPVPLINEFAGQPFPGNKIPAAAAESDRAEGGESVSARECVAIDL